jgi:hypothetical protein
MGAEETFLSRAMDHPLAAAPVAHRLAPVTTELLPEERPASPAGT